LPAGPEPTQCVYMRSSPAASFRRRGHNLAFTLIELVIVLVVLAVLAAIAIPTFASLVDNHRDRSVELTLNAVHTSATALAALEGRSVYTDADVRTALSEVPGFVAPGSWASITAAADGTTATAPGEVAYAISGDGTVLSLAAVSPTGNAVFAQGTFSTVETWSVSGCDADAIAALTATPGTCDTEGGTPPPTTAPEPEPEDPGVEDPEAGGDDPGDNGDTVTVREVDTQVQYPSSDFDPQSIDVRWRESNGSFVFRVEVVGEFGTVIEPIFLSGLASGNTYTKITIPDWEPEGIIRVSFFTTSLSTNVTGSSRIAMHD
jgi:prepilin-type N-terminal cleavage/methylation domain-containing protein